MSTRARAGAVTPRLFCFPYAGAGTGLYRSWAPRLAGLDVRPVCMPGRERRYGEPMPSTLEEAVADTLGELREELEGPFAFFGHSMGALLAFELARHLRRLDIPGPSLLLLSGRTAPQVARRAGVSRLSDEALADEIRRLQPASSERAEVDELIRLMLPTLRTDVRLCEEYVYHAEAPLGIPIVVFGGLDDPGVSVDDLCAWREHATGFRAHLFEGDHFFLTSDASSFLQTLAAEARAGLGR
jgi:medium-chain acyl-[acyl-carrier-protein] hydrolase